jgi:hypothetical protein
MSLESDGGMIYWRGKPKNSDKYLCHFVHHKSGVTRARTRASAVRDRRLTTWAMARPLPEFEAHQFSLLIHIWQGSRGSSVSIVSGYGLDDRGLIPGRGKGFFSVTSESKPAIGAQPVSCSMFTGVLSPGLNRDRGVTVTTHPHLVPKSWINRNLQHLSPCASISVLWDCLPFCINLTKIINSVSGHCKQCISCNWILLQEFNMATGFVVSCMKGLTWSS